MLQCSSQANQWSMAGRSSRSSSGVLTSSGRATSSSPPRGATVAPRPAKPWSRASAHTSGSSTSRCKRTLPSTTRTAPRPPLLGLGAYQARGAPFHADGFACLATAEGAGSQWASSWQGTYYAYHCSSASAQVAFNWGPHYDTCGASATRDESPSGGATGGGGSVVVSGGGGSPCPGAGQFGAGHNLLPSVLGQGQCRYQEFVHGSFQAQIAVSEANCAQADALGISAYNSKGLPFTTDGFNCKANAEGAGSEWAPVWGGTYYVYNCRAGLVQVAFNWGEHYIG